MLATAYSLNFDAILFFPLGRALYDVYLIIIAIFIWFLRVVCLIEAGTRDFLICENQSCNYTKVEFSFISKLSLTPFISIHRKAPLWCEPSYIPIFRLIQSAVCSVGVSKDRFCFAKMINYNSKDLKRILTKIDGDNCLLTPDKCTKFHLDWSTSFWVTAIFSSVWKDYENKKTWKFAHSYLGNASYNFLQIWFVVSFGRRAPPQQLWD